MSHFFWFFPSHVSSSSGTPMRSVPHFPCKQSEGNSTSSLTGAEWDYRGCYPLDIVREQWALHSPWGRNSNRNIIPHCHGGVGSPRSPSPFLQYLSERSWQPFRWGQVRSEVQVTRQHHREVKLEVSAWVRTSGSIPQLKTSSGSSSSACKNGHISLAELKWALRPAGVGGGTR